jgi:primosomal protein N''
MNSFKPSAAAVHTAHTLTRNFLMREKPGCEYELNFDNLVKLIDVFTQAHRVEKVLENLAQRVHWLRREELLSNLEAFQDAARTIEIMRKGMPQFLTKEDEGVSAPALAATRVLMRNFEFTINPEVNRIQPTERNIAITIDVCTKIRVAESAMDEVLALPWKDKNDLRGALDSLREAVRGIEFAKNKMPSYPSEIVPVWQKHKVQEPQFTSRQMGVLKEASKALDQAKSPAEEQRILQGVSEAL